MVECPKGHRMVVRKGRYGTFYGCTSYPSCRETRTMSYKSSSKSKTKKEEISMTSKLCSGCGKKKVREYKRGNSRCISCNTTYTKNETQLLIEEAPIELNSLKVPEVEGSGPGSKESDEFGLMNPILTYYEMCSRGTRRIGGLTNVFENATKGKDVIDGVPKQEFLDMKNNVIEIESKTLLGLFRESEIDPETHPLQFGALWITGTEKRQRREKPDEIKRICAPLLIFSVDVEFKEGNTCTVSFEDVYPALNYPLVEYLADMRGMADGGIAFSFEKLLDSLPNIPLEKEELETFLKTLDGFLPIQKLDLTSIGEFEDDSFDSPFENSLSLINTFAIFKGADMAPLTVVKEIEALLEADTFEDSALLNTLLPVEISGNELYEKENYLGNTEKLQEEFTHNFEFLPLSDTQRDIIKSTRSRPLTLVTGPPGTGKSHTITAVILDQIVTGRKVLLTSNTRKAVEVVVEKLDELCGPFVVAMSGGRREQNKLAKKLDDLINPGAMDDVPTKKELETLQQEYESEVERLETLSTELEKNLQDLTTWSQKNLLLKKFKEKEIEVPTEKGQNTKKLLNKITKVKKRNSNNFISKSLERRIVISVAKSMEIDPTTINNLEEAINYLEALQTQSSIELDLVKSKYHRSSGKLIREESKLAYSWEIVEKADENLRSLALKYLSMRRQLELSTILSNPKNNRQIADFRNALKRADNVAKKEILENVSSELLLDLFPCWASTDNFLSHILPLKPRMFHLSVIDEASYCRVDSAIPTLYRARKALVVGDPNQLKPVMFLSKTLNNAAIAKSGISKPSAVTYDFKRPLFDIVSENLDSNAKFMLDEHFRSEQEIIMFSSDQFYKSKLSLMTQKPRFKDDFDSDYFNMPINVHYVEGKRKGKTGPNEKEAIKAIEVAREIISRNPEWSVGILTPFRSQADYGSSLLGNYFSNNEIVKNKLLFDTAHQLQGDERDAIIISFTLDGDYLTNQLNWMQDETGVFNVSITRARKELHIVSTLQPTNLPKGLLKEFLEYAEDNLVPAPPSNEYDSKFEEEVAIRLVDENIKVLTQFEAAGYFIDLVASKYGEVIGIECDGPTHFDADGVRTERDLERHMKLLRAGWNLHRISYIDWELDPEREINKIKKAFSYINTSEKENLEEVRNIINKNRQ